MILKPKGWAQGMRNPDWQLSDSDPRAEVEMVWANGDEMPESIEEDFIRYVESLPK